jgi:hypothetical protein
VYVFPILKKKLFLGKPIFQMLWCSYYTKDVGALHRSISLTYTQIFKPMKKLFLLFSALIMASNLFAQPNKTFLISASGNYIQNSSDNGTTTNTNATFGKYLDASLSAGVFVSDKFVVGLGLDYYWSKEQRKSFFFINQHNPLMEREFMTIRSDGVVPEIFAGYYFKILNNFYFNVNLEVGVGRLKSETESIIVTSIDFTQGSVVNEVSSYLLTHEYSEKYDYFRSGIRPTLNYFITKHLGICLTMGQVEYSFFDWDTDNSNWAVSFNPSYWTYGFKLKFDAKVE